MRLRLIGRIKWANEKIRVYVCLLACLRRDIDILLVTLAIVAHDVRTHQISSYAYKRTHHPIHLPHLIIYYRCFIFIKQLKRAQINLKVDKRKTIQYVHISACGVCMSAASSNFSYSPRLPLKYPLLTIACTIFQSRPEAFIATNSFIVNCQSLESRVNKKKVAIRQMRWVEHTKTHI